MALPDLKTVFSFVSAHSFAYFCSMIQTNNRVLLGMSGGTDSSVAAILLQDAGYEVTGITFRFYEKDHQTEYLEDARKLAGQLGIRHLTYDVREQFNQTIIHYFVEEYLAGRTPVPCTLCNNLLKWPLLEQIADQENIYYIATGHYVRKTEQDGLYYLTHAADPDKDQSFFLWGLKQNILKRMLLPMGDITKVQARQIAARRGFEKAATKKDSTGVCFCPNDYRPFLHNYLIQHKPEVCIQPGNFLNEEGQKIGQHTGYPNYTIGQRRGLGIQLNKAVFVKETDPVRNTVTLSSLKALEMKGMWLKDWNLINPEKVFGYDDVIVKIRYRKQYNTGTVIPMADGRLYVQLQEPLTSVACGQAAAFYRKGLLLGGGIIQEAHP